MKRALLRDNHMLQRFVLVFLFVGNYSAVIGGIESFKQSPKNVPVSAGLLKEVGLQADWQTKLPLKKTERPRRMIVFQRYLYVLTDRNYLFCVDREDGKLRFQLRLAPAGLEILEPQYYDGLIIFTIGSEISSLDPNSGTIKSRKRFKNIGKGAVYPVKRNSKHLFIAGLDKRIHAIVADEYWEEFAVTADNDSLINSIVVDEDFVVFSTVSGNIIRTLAEAPKKLWQRDIPGTISAPITRDGGWIYVGSDNNKLYKLEIETGRSGWAVPFHAGDRLSTAAVAGKNVIYQYAGHNGLYAVDKETGQMLWQVPGGIGLLTEKGERAYVFAEPGMLAGFNNNTGRKLFSLDLPGVSAFATNTVDSTIYLGDNSGRLMSFSERQ